MRALVSASEAASLPKKGEPLVEAAAVSSDFDGGVGGVHDGGDDGGGCCRAAGHGAGRQRAVAEHDVDLVDGDAGAVADDLRDDGVGSGADVLRGGGGAGGAVVAQADVALADAAACSPGGAGDAPAEDEVARAHGADCGCALGPAELFRADLETLFKVARGEGLAVGLVGEGVEAEAELHGIHVELEGELVHGGLQREEAGDRAGAAHRRGRADVAFDQRRGDAEVGRAVEEGRGFAAVLADVVDE